ncbi:MAG TPA: DUF883 domain-containing protein [Roseiarcus sp.]|nr:DUF883 domain-containing protein [Roseiarcus sp.]
MSDDDARDASGHDSDGAERDRLEKNVSAIKDDITHLAQQIGDAVNTLAGLAQKRAKRRYKDTRANVDSAVSGASDRADALSDAAQNAAASLGETLEDLVQERPLATLGVALGLGFLLGLTWRR